LRKRNSPSLIIQYSNRRFSSETKFVEIQERVELHKESPPLLEIAFLLLRVSMAFTSSTWLVGDNKVTFLKRSCFIARRSCKLQFSPTPKSHARTSFSLVAKDTSWTGKVPPSTVLGIGEKVPSAAYLISSVACLLIGSYCVYESNLLTPLTVSTINPLYVLGSLLVPYSWGLHVAGWIQLKNGK